MIVKRLFRQNHIDFIINIFGNLDRLPEIMVLNNIRNINEFYNRTEYIIPDNIPQNDTTRHFKLYNTEVVTGLPVIIGDFNNDYNNDYFNNEK